MTSAWVGVIGALGGAGMATVAGFANGMIQHRREEATRISVRESEQTQALYDLRREAYVRFLVSTHPLADLLIFGAPETSSPVDFVASLTAMRRETGVPFEEFDTAASHVSLLAGIDVSKAMKGYTEWFAHQSKVALGGGPEPVATAFDDWEAAESPLIAAMKEELRATIFTAP